MTRPESGFVRGRTNANTVTYEGTSGPHTPYYCSLSTFFGQTQGSGSPGIRARQGGKEFTVRNQQETIAEGNLEAIRRKFEVD